MIWRNKTYFDCKTVSCQNRLARPKSPSPVWSPCFIQTKLLLSDASCKLVSPYNASTIMQFDPLGSTAASPTTPTSAAPVVVPTSVPTPPSASPAGGNTNATPGVVPVDTPATGNGSSSAAAVAVPPAGSSVSRRVSGGGARAPHYADEVRSLNACLFPDSNFLIRGCP